MIALPLAIAWISAVLVTALDGRRRPAIVVASLSLGSSLAASSWLLLRVMREGPTSLVTGGWPAGIGIALRVDVLGAVFLVMSLGLLFVATLSHMASPRSGRHFPALVLFLATGLTGLFITGDAFNFYVFFEIAMASSFVLVADAAGDRSLREALVFMVLNLVGSALLLAGVAGLYRLAGTLDMVQIAARQAGQVSSGSLAAGALILAAFSVKLGLFPFHTWLPPVYRTTTAEVAAILSGVLASIGSYGLLRFGGELMPASAAAAAPLLLAFGAASIVYGSVAAVGPWGVRDVLAYSSIGQVGYVLVALAVGGAGGYAAALLYSIANAVDKTILFLSSGSADPRAASSFTLGALSLAGLPPSVGFIAKVALFTSLIASGSTWGIAVVLAGTLLSFVYVFSARRLLVRAQLDQGGVRLWSGAVVLALGIAAIGVAVWPSPLVSVAQLAVATFGGAR